MQENFIAAQSPKEFKKMLAIVMESVYKENTFSKITEGGVKNPAFFDRKRKPQMDVISKITHIIEPTVQDMGYELVRV